MKTVLVTGACGLIGQHLCSGLLKKQFAVIGVDRESSVYNEGKYNYSFVQANPDDRNAYAEIFDKYKIDIVIHAACTVDNDLGSIITDEQVKESERCDKFIYRYAMTNENVKMFILLSTDQVYEFPKTREPIREDDDLKPRTNYAVMKFAAEKSLLSEMSHHKDEDGEYKVICCILRFAPVYTLNYTDNLIAKITDPKDGVKFVSGKGQYGFQLCCVHNLVDFILSYVKSADNNSYAGIYNVSDKLLITAADIIAFMRAKHSLGTVVQRSPGSAMNKLKGLFSGSSKDEKINYRYNDLSKLENNNMLDKTKASKLTNFRWDINNTK